MFSFFKKLFNFRTTETNSGNKDKQVDLESTNDTHLSKKLKSNDNYQRGQSRKYSSFSSLNSNKTAFTSSDKSQCQSSRRAAKMITKLADSMFLQSDEEISDESDYVIEELSKYKNKPMNTPKMIKKPSKRDLKRTTIRFCQKCKTLKTIVGHVTKRKHCDRCKNILFYICSYCKEKCYASHKGCKIKKSSQESYYC
ncbi:uncharacterized protein LOC131669963 [Phymastichus coffea]|uniref:uncharacterized protein LOC131669963 n=1 Tax=Phymastichus coffea TaxID=108790 RepID=UPI00273BF7F9|nr:uncharacterized protein LOC131669963 [Phymastichus coffea]